MTDIFDLIDGAVEASGDAMRWTPEPPTGEPESAIGARLAAEAAILTSGRTRTPLERLVFDGPDDQVEQRLSAVLDFLRPRPRPTPTCEQVWKIRSMLQRGQPEDWGWVLNPETADNLRREANLTIPDGWEPLAHTLFGMPVRIDEYATTIMLELR